MAIFTQSFDTLHHKRPFWGLEYEENCVQSEEVICFKGFMYFNIYQNNLSTTVFFLSPFT